MQGAGLLAEDPGWEDHSGKYGIENDHHGRRVGS